MTQNITILTAELHNALKAIPHFAAKENAMVPVLSAGHLVVRNGYLILEATDRYKLIQVKVRDLRDDEDLNPNGVEDGELGIIPLRNIKQLEQFIREEARSKQKPTTTLELDAERHVLEVRSNLTNSVYSVQLEIDSQYPDIDSLFPKEFSIPEKLAPFDQFALEYWQQVAKVQHTKYPKSRQNIIIHGSEGSKPVHLYWIADGVVWAQGLLMPIRIPEGGEPLPRFFD